MKIISKKGLLWGSAAAAACCWAYSLAARFTDFFFTSKLEKVSILASLLTITVLLSIWLFWFILPPFIKGISKKTGLIMLALSILLVSLAFLAFYQLPPFPEQHTLTLTPLAESNPLSNGSKVEIVSISTISLPGKNSLRVPRSQLRFEGVWQGVGNEFGLLANNSSGISVTLDRFMQAGVDIIFTVGPDGGTVHIRWDKTDSTLDLYAQQPGTITLSLQPALDWRGADRTRKLLVAAAFASDFIGLVALIFIFSVILTQLISTKQLTVKKPLLLISSLMLIIVMWGIVLKIDQPVVFENPQIEAVVREFLEKPIGEIYQRQILTIVKLDASDRGITDLEGIGQLPNLIELDLSGNNIVDLAPLSHLPHLEKLNVRGNQVTDLSPLSSLTRLDYLNIYGNQGVQSIAPLINLTNLRTLIMANVPIRDEIGVLKDLTRLTYLNLKGCDLTDLEPLARLTNLEYLNLASNPLIRSFEPLRGIIKLRTLILASTPFEGHIQVLEKLSNLNYLNLRSTGLTDISILSKLTSLEYLNLHSNPEIRSLAPLRNLVNLNTLILRNVPVGDQLELINNFPDLRILNLRNTGITDLSTVGALMEKGAIQDDPKLGLRAALDIRDNQFISASPDPFESVRLYWDHISTPQPIALPFYAALSNPSFSRESGFYADNFQLEISSSNSSAAVHYTLDGSLPGMDSAVYTSPIQISDRVGEPDQYATIESIAADWNAPENGVSKAAVVRAVAIDPKTGASSAVITRTYFVGPDFSEKYTLPVVSLVTDPANFFDDRFGIYVLGNAYAQLKDVDLPEDEKQLSANFSQRGREWESPIHIELFEAEGQVAFSQDAGVRIHGGGSRRTPQKSLRLYARREYDLAQYFEYPLFSGKPNSTPNNTAPVYKEFLLRDSGQDWLRSMFRDSFIQSLVSHTRLDTQAGRSVIVYLNGEYWGIYDLQERYDEYYFSNKYGVAADDVTILRQNGELFRGTPEAQEQYYALLKYIRNHDLSSSANFEYLQTQIDVDSYMDYLITEIFSGNDDWPANNIYFWKMNTDGYQPLAPYGQDGRWRWMIFDMDFGFGLMGGEGAYMDNTLELAQMDGWGGFLFRALLENETFKENFINRFADHINSTFAPQRVISIVDQNEANLKPEMRGFFERWDPREVSLEKWKSEIELMRVYAQERPAAVRNHLIDQFGLSGTAALTLHADQEKGYLIVNSLEINSNTIGIQNPGSWNGVYFQGVPVTVTAIPNLGYKFAGWDGIDQAEPVVTLNLQGDLELTALFIQE